MGWVVFSDAVLESRDTVLIIVVTASCCICNTVSATVEKFLSHVGVGLPPNVYSLVNHHKVSKDIWDRVKLLIQGTSLSKQERECKLYDEFDKFFMGRVIHWHLAQRIKPSLYDGNALSKTHDVLSMVDEEETLILAEESRLKMVEKQNDPIMKKEKINITPINYYVLNKLAEDFGKRFVSQQELSAEQMFWLQSSNKNSEEPSTLNTPAKIEVPSELPKNEDSVDTCNKCMELEVELVKKNNVYIELSKRFSYLEQHCISLEVSMQLNQEIFQKDKSSDNQNNSEIQEYFEQNALKAQLQAKDIVINKLKETIHSLRENVNLAKVKQDIDEIETINIELEHSVAKLVSENEKLHKEKEHSK
ncbi:hypothetical protein Tco_0381908 [Tanacetum coccineum]